MKLITDLFTWVKFDPLVEPEFPLDFYPPPTELPLDGDGFTRLMKNPGTALARSRPFATLVMPGSGRQPEKSWHGDYLSVPQYEVRKEAPSAEQWSEALSAMWDDVYADARQLLHVAAALNPPCDGRSRDDVLAAMRRQFSRVYRTDREDEVEVNWFEDGQDVLGVYRLAGDNLVVPVKYDSSVRHDPPAKPVCSITLGMAVLDHRAVLRGRVAGGPAA